jgi:hypothetical protein
LTASKQPLLQPTQPTFKYEFGIKIALYFGIATKPISSVANRGLITSKVFFRKVCWTLDLILLDLRCTKSIPTVSRLFGSPFRFRHLVSSKRYKMKWNASLCICDILYRATAYYTSIRKFFSFVTFIYLRYCLLYEARRVPTITSHALFRRNLFCAVVRFFTRQNSIFKLQ